MKRLDTGAGKTAHANQEFFGFRSSNSPVKVFAQYRNGAFSEVGCLASTYVTNYGTLAGGKFMQNSACQGASGCRIRLVREN
jgi:hypothetical protein